MRPTEPSATSWAVTRETPRLLLPLPLSGPLGAAQVGDVSKPAGSLVEASSRRIVELQIRKEEDRREMQVAVVKKFMEATAQAFEEKNPGYANDPAVHRLLHDDVVLITYDKMKFYGKKTVQKKINAGECSCRLLPPAGRITAEACCHSC